MNGPLTCPHCGSPAHRITPMGFWEKDNGYSPRGVRYVCGMLYQTPPKSCPGSAVFYGENAEELAIAAWNTRTPDPAAIRADALREALAIAQEAVARRIAQIEEERKKPAFNIDVPQLMRWGAGKLQAEQIAGEILALIGTPPSPTAVDGSPAPDDGGKEDK